jgi:hypothetical protein
MDIFNTTVTSIRIIYIFLDGCKDFSEDAKSLAVRFDHDSQALQRVLDYFASKTLVAGSATSEIVLPPAYQTLLDDCVRFLEGLLLKAQSLGARIKSKKWYRVGINQSTWWYYKGDFEDLAKELFEWTRRFDIHTFSLPNSIKTVINLETEPSHLHSTSSPLSLLAVQQRVAKVVELDGDARVKYGEQLHVEGHESRIVSGITVSQPAATRPYSQRNVYPQRMATFDGQPVILEERDAWRHFSYEDHRHLASV